MLTAQQAAASLGISVKLVYRLCQNGRLAHYRIGGDGGRIRISPEDIARFLLASRKEEKGEEHEAPPTAIRRSPQRKLSFLKLK